MVDAAREKAEFRFDDMIVELHPNEHGVDVTFERAAAARFDLVVGADGLHSAVRRMSFGPEPGFVTHLGMYVATVRLCHPAERDDAVMMYNEPGAAVAVRPGTGTPMAAFMFRSPIQAHPRDAAAARQLMTAVNGNESYSPPTWQRATPTSTPSAGSGCRPGLTVGSR